MTFDAKKKKSDFFMRYNSNKTSHMSSQDALYFQQRHLDESCGPWTAVILSLTSVLTYEFDPLNLMVKIPM